MHYFVHICLEIITLPPLSAWKIFIISSPKYLYFLFSNQESLFSWLGLHCLFEFWFSSIVVSFGKLPGYSAHLVSCCLTPSFDVLYTAQAQRTLSIQTFSVWWEGTLYWKLMLVFGFALMTFMNKLENNAPKVLLPGGFLMA